MARTARRSCPAAIHDLLQQYVYIRHPLTQRSKRCFLVYDDFTKTICLFKSATDSKPKQKFRIPKFNLALKNNTIYFGNLIHTYPIKFETEEAATQCYNKIMVTKSKVITKSN